MILFFKIVIVLDILSILIYLYFGVREVLEIRRMRREGLSWSEIADILKVPRS